MIGLWKKISAALILVLCAGCSKHQEKTRLLLDWWPNPNHVAIFAGKEKGIFAKHGIDLDIVSLQDPPDAITYLSSGQADIGVYYFPQTMRAFSEKQGVHIIGKLTEGALNSFMCRADKEIHSIEDFNGKVLGAFADGVTEAYCKTLAKSKGIAFSEMKHVQFDVAAALYADTIDVISGVCWNIEPDQLLTSGVKTRTFQLKELGVPDYPELIFAGSKSFCYDKPEQVMAFRRAMQEAIDYCRSHPDDAFSLYLAANPDKSQTTVEWETRAWQKTLPILATSQQLDRNSAETFQQWMLETKLQEKPCAIDSLEFTHAL